jgi:hypothetical protein
LSQWAKTRSKWILFRTHGVDYLSTAQKFDFNYSVTVRAFPVWKEVEGIRLKQFQAPEAVLFSDAGTHGEIGIHYVGPTWESESGSKVKGAAIANAPSPNANSIPLLLLKAVSTEGPGVFERTTFIQRLNTVGGRAPATGGTTGQVVRVPYTAEYFFYREQN